MIIIIIITTIIIHHKIPHINESINVFCYINRIPNSNIWLLSEAVHHRPASYSPSLRKGVCLSTLVGYVRFRPHHQSFSPAGRCHQIIWWTQNWKRKEILCFNLKKRHEKILLVGWYESRRWSLAGIQHQDSAPATLDSFWCQKIISFLAPPDPGCFIIIPSSW